MKKGGYFTDYSILGRSPLFRGIPAGDFGVLLEHLKTETRSYKKGDLICHAGEHTNALGIVLTGSVTIESDDIFGNRSVSGSNIGGIAQTQEMLDFCGDHNITADVEVIPVQKINEAWGRLEKADVKYRFVIDLASMKS